MVIDPRALEQVLPLAAASLAHKRAQLHEHDNELLVPVAVAEYLAAMPDAKWYDRAMFPGIVDHAALTAGPAGALLALQAWILRSAWSTLADWWGQEAAGWHDADQSKRRAAGRDWEPAAQQLFGCHASMLDWVGPHADWVNHWREIGTTDPEILEHAGLGEAELALLSEVWVP